MDVTNLFIINHMLARTPNLLPNTACSRYGENYNVWMEKKEVKIFEWEAIDYSDKKVAKPNLLFPLPCLRA